MKKASLKIAIPFTNQEKYLNTQNYEKNTDKQTFLHKSEKIFVLKKIFVGKKGL